MTQTALTAQPTPEWTRHAIWWHVYPLGFVGAPIRPSDGAPDGQPWQAHRLSRLTAWLDHAVALGCSGLLLGPIFASTSHGYDTTDHFQIDPRLGDDADFDALVAACRERGLRIVLDGVFSHVGREHPAVEQNSPLVNHAEVFEGHGDLVRLDHSTSEARDLAVEVMTHWLRRGIDGWRLDAAYSVPTDYWRETIDRVRADHPDAWFLAEVIHGDYPAFVRESGVDSLTQYELWKAIWSSLVDGNFFELEWTMRRHDDLLATFVPQTFVGNHDVTRIATKVGADLVPLAMAVLATTAGIPSVYAGDEQGYTGTKSDALGGDDEVRPPFPDGPDELSPFGAGAMRTHQDLIGLRRRHPWLVNARSRAVDVANRSFTYRTTSTESDEAWLETTLRLDPPGVTITGPEGVVWQR
ncbi:alpha-amylase family protein [Aestuariimicrobium ganziense]|uniref:alpha-amylase family protein n=1 Tax=Aestuariimicrobium ganziense TaxID=2773677 RepID=UPI0019424134|nr:alpha-amylase family protein [Aestuariimicrobium ganziense]